MPNNKVATLTSKGWVDDPESKADALLSYYFTNQHSQSTLFEGGVISLQWQLQQWGNDPVRLQSKMETAFQSYLADHFDQAAVDVVIVDPTSVEDNRITVQINALVTQDGKSYSLGRLVSFLNSTIVKIMNLNNGTTTAMNV